MAKRPAQILLEREMRVSFGGVPHTLDGEELAECSWHLSGDQFLLRSQGDHYFHYRKGEGVRIDRGAGGKPDTEQLWLSGSVYSAVASINGLMALHVSAVCCEGRVFGFTGASGAGKSTLVTALAHRGLPLFCDDTLVLDLSEPDRIVCLPGHKRLKLTEQALRLTGVDGQEKVGGVFEKYYAEPAAIWQGGVLPFAQLCFLETGDTPQFLPMRGSERMLRLRDDHYTTQFFEAASQLDPQAYFAHLARLARQIEMSRFVRPFDEARFEDGMSVAERYIRGQTSLRPEVA